MKRPTINIKQLRHNIMMAWKVRTGNFILPEFILKQMLSYHTVKLKIEIIILGVRILALIKIIKIEE